MAEAVVEISELHSEAPLVNNERDGRVVGTPCFVYWRLPVDRLTRQSFRCLPQSVLANIREVSYT